MLGIFVSYRRDDTAANAGRICDRLSNHFGPERVFFDRNTIQPGADFVAQIEESVALAAAVVVVIGERWLTCVGPDGKRRLDDPEDLVRREIVVALKGGIPLYPVLVSGARFPAREELPEPLRDICRRNALEVADRSFQHDLDCLIEAIGAAQLGRASAPALSLHGPSGGSESRLGTVAKKVCMVGSFGVGKTSLVRRFVESIFTESYMTTIGVLISKKVLIVGQTRIELILWDLAGDDDVTPLRVSNLRGASGYILVADGLRAGTLEKAQELRHRVEETAGVLPFVLAVNKSDLRQVWQIKDATIGALSKSWAVFPTSAKTGQGVDKMFRTLVERILSGGEVP
jgi:small GTP-binding protein